MSNRLPETKRLSEILPAGREGGLEFARIVDLLLFYSGRRDGQNTMLFSDRSGDFMGLDSYSDGPSRQQGRTGYQYKFYPSPLSNEHRSEIKQALQKAAKARAAQEEELRFSKWILVTPDDLSESAQRKDGGDVSWFQGLRKTLKLKFDIEHWGHRKLQALFIETPTLGLFYYPELVAEGAYRRRSIEEVRLQCNQCLQATYGRIEFVGMSVYKPEAIRGVAMEHIYIPLSLVAEGADDHAASTQRQKPMAILQPGSRHVILGDPGSGKSTLLKFIALAGISPALQKRYDIQADNRLPILIVLRKYADALKENINLPLLDYMVELLKADFSLAHLDQAFLAYYLESGNAILLFDGMDELPDPQFKQIVRDRIHCLLNNYPFAAAVITSRIVGYENPHRFEPKLYQHHQLARLSKQKMADFVRDWYAVRLENPKERDDNISDLVRILHDEQQLAIRDLASNPLLLTIIALVHRVDAELPDERVVLYQKCTETLLNTWHAWKASTRAEKRNRTERINRARIEALAYWMHCNAGSTLAKQRAVVSHEATLKFLREHISQHEKAVAADDAEDVAEDFLRFIKNSAGLLIEVGDRQYSFIHLTFQEYLTATYLVTSTEGSGNVQLWEMLAPHTSEARWQEVIRLLLAGLKNDDNQEFFLKQLFAQAEKSHSSHLALLLGGVLQDHINAADQLAAQIICYLLQAIAHESEAELVKRLVALTKSFKQAPDDADLLKGYALAWKRKALPIPMLLAGFAIGLDEQQLRQMTGEALDDSNANELRAYLTSSAIAANTPLPSIARLYVEIAASSITDPWSNLLACFAEAITPECHFPKHAFIHRLFLMNDMSNGIFQNLGRYSASLSDTKVRQTVFPIALQSDGVRERMRMRMRMRVWARARARALELERQLARERARVRERVRVRVRVRESSSLPQFEETIASAFPKDACLPSTSSVNSPSATQLWTAILLNNEFVSDLLAMCVDGLSLSPAPLWTEAMRTAFLPQVPARLWLYNPENWPKITDKFAQQSADENDIYAAACLLLHDIWLHLYEIHPTREQSRLRELAELTRTHAAPALQIAHCLRDFCYGDNERAIELKAMLGEPKYAEVFRAAYWID